MRNPIQAEIIQPFDFSQTTVVADATAATSNPYRPFTASGTTQLQMGGFTGVMLRVKYVAASTFSVAPTIAVWGLRGGNNWQRLRDERGDTIFTFSTSSTDCSNGTNSWTDGTFKIDSVGCEKILVTVITAATMSSGAASIEAARY